MAETCSFCNRSVRPGSGWFANRIPDASRKTRLAEGRPYPEGEFVCCECVDRLFPPEGGDVNIPTVGIILIAGILFALYLLSRRGPHDP